jgi:hypothetical protein
MPEITQMPSNKSGGVAEWAAKLKPLCTAVLDAAKSVVPQAIGAGAELYKAKHDVGHGNWLPLLKLLGLKERTATRWITIANGKIRIDKWLRDKSATMADLTLVKAEEIASGKSTSGGGDSGALGNYQKTQGQLIKKLRKLPSEDMAEAANATIAELHAVVADLKPAVKNAA